MQKVGLKKVTAKGWIKKVTAKGFP